MDGGQEAVDANKELAKLASAYNVAFSGPSGREVLRDLIEKYVIAPVHVPGDPHTTEYNLGKRDAVLELVEFAALDFGKILIEELKATTNAQ